MGVYVDFDQTIKLIYSLQSSLRSKVFTDRTDVLIKLPFSVYISSSIAFVHWFYGSNDLPCFAIRLDTRRVTPSCTF